MDETVLHEVRRLLAPEPEPTTRARERAGMTAPPAPEVGALLRWAARTVSARGIVEVGAAGGVSALWLVPELPERGVLTSIEPDPHAHALATEAIAGIAPSGRVRSILGDPLTVLDRLSDGAYDLAILQSEPAATTALLAHVRRLLRPGGVLLVRGALRHGEHAEVLARFLQSLGDDDAFTATVLPVDDGLVLATRLEDPSSA